MLRFARHTAFIAISFLRFLVATAHADPVEVVLQNQIAPGQKPTIALIAKEAIISVQLDIERMDDHKHFHHTTGPIAQGAQATLSIGDGKSGLAHWKGRLRVRASSGETTSEVRFESTTLLGGSSLKVTYDRAHLDLDKGSLQFQISQAAARAELSVMGENGEQIAKAERDLSTQKPGQWIEMTWTPSAIAVLRLELRIARVGGDAVIVKLVPWSVSIAHEEVIFPSGKSDIIASETGKLDASYQKIVDAVDKVRKHEPQLDVRVYVAGHTDSVGGSDENRKLSLARAKAIAAWFADRGLPLPLYYAGFGEDRPRVKTADNVDEAQNRRADYVLGVEPPAQGQYQRLK